MDKRQLQASYIRSRHSTMKGAVLVLLTVIGVCDNVRAGGFMPTITSSSTTLEDIVRAQKALTGCANKVNNSQFEEATLLVSEQFVQYVAADAQLNTSAVAELYAKYHWHKTPTASDIASAENFVPLELNATLSILQHSLDQCEAIANGTRGRPPFRTLPTLSSDGFRVGPTGHLINPVDGRPYFPFGYVWGPDAPASKESNHTGAVKLGTIGATLAGCYIIPGHVDENLDVNPTYIEEIKRELLEHEAMGLSGSHLFGHGGTTESKKPVAQAMPAWAESKYPG